ncbi:MAG: helix-turn-helix domain-containing protein [Pseudomonadota bacterium]|nr:helix-turn-helix domain-containing protein [Pseudomonadota bacterium]
MIGLIVKNNLCRDTLLEVLSSLMVEVYTPDHHYDAVLVAEDSLPDGLGNTPVITLGHTITGSFYQIKTPVHPIDLVHDLQSVLNRLTQRITFENADFIFRAGDRSLMNKANGALILLTEKENDLLSALASAYPNALSKEALLKQVWNYSPDTETHTLESHIYTLRQKIGGMADSLLQSTPMGYVLVPVHPE